MTSEIKHAIARSISHTEIVRLFVADASDALKMLENYDEVTDIDHARENNGALDVWGTRDGEGFRLRLTDPTTA